MKMNLFMNVKVLLFTVFTLFYAAYCAYGATVEGNTQNASQGDTVVLTFSFASSTSTDKVSSINFDLNYDASNFTLNDVEIGAAASSSSKVISRNTISAGVERIIVYGINNTEISNGELVQANFTIKGGASDGSSAVTITELVAASPTAANIPVTISNAEIVVDSSAPSVVITSPSDDEYLNSDSVQVSGTLDDASITTVDINGNAVNVTAGEFSGTVSVDEGSQTITVVAIDGAGNEGSTSVTVNIDLSDPVITITSPSEGDLIGDESVNVSGTVDDATVTTVNIGGTSYNVTNGNFSGSVSVAEGSTTISVSATDAAGNSNSSSVEITVDITGPTITVSDPNEGESFATQTISISGSVDDVAISEIDINGETVVVSDGDFSKSLTVDEGNISITLTAVDAAGNSSTKTVNIVVAMGDINKDGEIDELDMNLVKNQVLGIDIVSLGGDVNTDGSVNIVDLQAVINKL